jgi:hypothetical protein
MRNIVCKGCGASVILHGDEDPHAALACGCCPEDHHHGQAAATTGIACRPVTHIFLGPGQARLTG